MIADEGFYFGLGAFETIALINGEPFFLDAHMNRLTKTMHFLNISYEKKDVFREMELFLASQNNISGRKALKITVSPHNILFSLRENPYKEEDYLNGFLTGFSSIRRNETSPLTYHKTLNYGDNILAKRTANCCDIQEPIFLNTQGELAEGAVTNLFFLQNGQIVAPPLSVGMLPGIVRDYIYSHYTVKEKRITPKDIPQFQEMFLTNSLLGIMPVRKLENYQFSSMKNGLSISKQYWIQLFYLPQ